MEAFWNHLWMILGSFGDNFVIILEAFWNHFGFILESFGDHLGVILKSFWALGMLLGRSGGPRRVPRVSKSVKMLILKLFNNFKEVLKSSWSDVRASKIAPGGAGNGPGATKE